MATNIYTDLHDKGRFDCHIYNKIREIQELELFAIE